MSDPKRFLWTWAVTLSAMVSFATGMKAFLREEDYGLLNLGFSIWMFMVSAFVVAAMVVVLRGGQ